MEQCSPHALEHLFIYYEEIQLPTCGIDIDTSRTTGRGGNTVQLKSHLSLIRGNWRHTNQLEPMYIRN